MARIALTVLGDTGLSSRRRGSRIRLRYVAVLGVCAWAAYYYFHVQQPELKKLENTEHSLQTQLSAARAQHTQLQTTAAEFQDKAYIERYAAERFNLIGKDQISFTVQH